MGGALPPIRLPVRVEQMQLRTFGRQPNLLPLADIDDARQLGDQRFAVGQVFEVEKRDFAERFDDIDRAFEEIVVAGGQRQVFRADAEAGDLPFSLAAVAIGTETVLPPGSETRVWSPASSIFTGTMFMAGEPMNWATKRLAGRS